MNKAFHFIIIAALTGSLCSPGVVAQSTVNGATLTGAGVVVAAGGAACTPSQTADLVNQTFDATGYDAPIWTENSGTGVTIDEDNTDATPLGASDCVTDKMLWIDRGSTDDQTARTHIDFTATDPVWMRFYMYVDSAALVADGNVKVVAGVNAGGATINATNATFISLVQTSGVLQLRLQKGGTVISTYSPFLEDTWYRVEMTMDDGANTEDWKLCLAGAATCDSVGSGTTDPGFTASRFMFDITNIGTVNGQLIYFDEVAVDSTGWIGE